MRKLFTITIAILLSANVWAQSPQKMSYQAIIRDAGKNLVTSHSIGMRISILQNSASGTALYTETQTASTNANGLVTLEIGTGTTSDDFSAINWANGPYFIKTETDPSGGAIYSISGTSELLSVPYALHAKTAESISGGITETDPVFMASPANGISSTQLTNWNTAYGWGNHAAAGYLTSFSEVDPKVGINTSGYSPKWNGSALVTGAIYQDATGSVGIGTTNLLAKLDINGAVKITDGTQGLNKVLTSDANGLASWQSTGATAWSLLGNAATIDGANFIGTTDNVALNFKVNNQLAGRIDPTLQNTFLGYQAGNVNTNIANTGIGYQALYANTSGIGNTAIGNRSLYINTTGPSNTACGSSALQNNNGGWNTAYGSQTLQNNTTGSWNSANGTQALLDNTTGNNNTASGIGALRSNATGSSNTASGMYALFNNVTGNNGVAIGYYSQFYANNTATAYDNTNTSVGYQSLMGSTNPSANTGTDNTAVGRDALYSNTTGFGNTVNGVNALRLNTTGFNNTSSGMNTLMSNTTGSANTAIGHSTLTSNTSGGANTAIGYLALYYNTTGSENTANGRVALHFNTTGDQNTATGSCANYQNTTGRNNTADGYAALASNTSGNYNTAIGSLAGNLNISGSSNVFLGNEAGYNETGSNKLYIANSRTNPPLIYGDFSSGNVGFGTTSPGAKLEVNGQIKITGGTSSQFLKADGSVDANTYITAVREVADEFSATVSQTVFSLTQAPSANSKVKMYINGVRISNTAYSNTGTTLTYVSANNGSYALSAGDRIQFDYSY